MQLQQRELMLSECESAHRSQISQRDEFIATLQSDVRVFEEKLTRSQQLVRGLCFSLLLYLQMLLFVLSIIIIIEYE